MKLSSGLVPCYEVQYDLLQAQKLGQLLKQRTSIFMHLSQKKCLRKGKNSQIECFKSKSGNIRRSRNLWKTLVDTKKTQSKFEILTYELGPLPLSTSNYDGTLRKTQKSKLFQLLKSSLVSCVTISENVHKYLMEWFCYKNYRTYYNI